jgi:8-oxo-dGTP pyrophosphatase MutT (NUDIX family)
MTRSDHLRTLLAAHRPEDAREASFQARMFALLEHEEAAFSRENFTPGHVTASAFVVAPDERRVLLILHGKLGLWLQPGGHVEPDDANVLEAARREVREEVGMPEVDVLGPGLLDIDIHEIPGSPKAPSHEHFDVRFLFRAPSLEALAGDDAKAVRWVSLDDAAFAGSDESVLRALRRIRRRA